METVELKKIIQEKLQAFRTGDLTENALALFAALGYNTGRSDPFPEKIYGYFKEQYINKLSDTRFNERNALVQEWQSIDMLFQLSTQEMSEQLPLFELKEVADIIINSYLVFALELQNSEYSRTKLARITREINKVFKMPVMVLFKYGRYLTLSVIHRRVNKKYREKDVLEKVTLIKDISVREPHRAHIEILFDLSLSELSVKYSVTDFVALHNAWQKVLDTKELNKRFYKELSYWYFWALQKVEFPNLHNEENHNEKSLIRLLTRLLFVWFVKEKGLVPEKLFNQQYIAVLLKIFDPRNDHGIKNQMKGSAYYRAVLQNLFFATLNQERGQRAFRKKGQNQNATTLFRYEDYFTDAQQFKNLIETVPFMNGGLFECLDKADPLKKGKEGGAVINYEDGFSDRSDNVLCVPDYLFFSGEDHADISGELDDARLRDVNVDGLITIFNKYKFTVAENTPVEEDIALDPELLGRVFENLLASYNPETKTTARKQTGSFYTPREIVDYMADISIKAYLQQKLIVETGMKDTEADAALELLTGYNENEHTFTTVQVRILINAIDMCKILDPACGSGAFPMGILHKLVYILGKLDPHNTLWRERQKQKALAEMDKALSVTDKAERGRLLKEIDDVFEQNQSDYGRKLYLVENCIFGVDIQSIAIQISKLRFFISLMVDQKTDSSHDNFGIRPLPNLETKFVAANTLIGLEKPPEATALFNEHKKLGLCKAALKNVRHRLFSAKTPATKNKLRAKDKAIREQIAQILIDDRWSDTSAKQIAEWEIDNQNASSYWFDAEWMFGENNGFDIVIGNPPYVQLQNNQGELADIYSEKKYECFVRSGDIYQLFYECGYRLLNERGHLCFITSNKWMRAGYGEKTRTFFADNANPKILIDFAGQRVFESTVDVNIILIEKYGNNKETLSCIIKEDCKNNITDYVKQHKTEIQFSSSESWVILSPIEQQIKAKIEKVGVPLKDWDISINYGIKTGCNEAFIINKLKRDELIAKDAKSADIIRPILRGRDIARYKANFAELYLINTHNGITSKNIPPVDVEKYPAIKEHLNLYWDKIKARDDKGVTPYNLRSCAYTEDFSKQKIIYPNMTKFLPFYYDEKGFFQNDKSFMVTGNHLAYLTAFFNSSLFKFCFIDNFPELLGGTRELRKIFFDKIPVLKVVDSINDTFIEKITKLQHLKTKCQNTRELEIDIDDMIFEMYQLTEKERKTIGFIEIQ